jgi:hypothetical protein
MGRTPRTLKDVPDAAAGGGARRPRRRSGLGRWIVGSVCVVVLCVAAALTLVLTLGLPRGQAIERLEALTGGKVGIARIQMSPRLGRVIVTDLTIDVPGLDGPAGRVLAIERAEITLSLASLMAGKARPKHVRLLEPTMRISVDQHGAVNLMELGLFKASPDEPAPLPPSTPAPSPTPGTPGLLAISLGQLPELEVIGAKLVLGEHTAGDGTAFTSLESLRVSGVIRPAADAPRAEIELYELLNKPNSHAVAPNGLRITGEIDTELNRLTTELTRIDLAQVDSLRPPTFVKSVWDRLQMSGQITRTRLLIGPAEGIVAEFSLDGVALTIPIDPPSQIALQDDGASLARPQPLRMSQVSGGITFSTDGVRSDLTGSLNDFHASVALNLDGYTATAPFDLNIRTTEPFRIAERPDLLPYAPEAVKEISKRFGGPTGLVSAAIVVNRGGPDDPEPGRIITRGYLRISDGTAAFENFPYPLLNVEASIGFEPDMVRIESVVARGPTGALISASGSIGPPGNEAGVDLHITAVDVPLDHVFRQTLESNGMDIMPVLFDEDAHARLLSDGLIQTPESKAETDAELAQAQRELAAALEAGSDPRSAAIERLRRRVAGLEERAAVPAFELGGRAALEIKVHRPIGPDMRYRTDILVRIREAGLLPAEFPYPILSRRLAIAIHDNDARVIESPFVALRGGHGSIAGTVRFRMRDGDRPASIDPMITIAAHDVPIDPLLLFALPRGDHNGSADGGHASGMVPFPVALSRLGLSGRVGCDAVVQNLAGEDQTRQRIGVRASIDIEGLRADPLAAMPDQHGPLLDNVSARIKLDDRSFTLEELIGRSGDGTVQATGHGTIGSTSGDNAMAVQLNVAARDLDIIRRIEWLVVAFAPDAADPLARLRSLHLPEGLFDIDAQVNVLGADVDYRLDVAQPRGTSFDVYGRRVHVERCSGGLTITPDAVVFSGFSATVREESAAPMSVELDGAFALRDGATSSLSARVAGARFESTLLRRWLEASTPREAAAIAAFELVGTFDADLRYEGVRGQSVPLRGSLSPRSAALTWSNHRFNFPATSGSIGLGETGGSIVGLQGQADDWSFRARGVWSRPAGTESIPPAERDDDAGVAIGLAIDLEASGTGWPDDVRALLPDEARIALDKQQFSIDKERGSFTVEAARFVKDPGVDGRILFEGTVGLRAAQITPVVHIGGIDATLDVYAERPAGADEAGVVVSAAADRLTLFGLGFGPARTKLLFGTEAGPGRGVSIPSIEVHGYSGMVRGSAAYPLRAIAEGGRISSEPPPFTLDLRMTGLDLGAVLDATTPAKPLDTTAAPATGGMSARAMQGKRGSIDASLFMTGQLDRPESHRGRGELVVQGGDILNIPGIVAVVKLANLMPGSDEPFSIATAAYSVRHDRVTFDSIVLEAPRSGTKLLGVGWMAIPSTELEMIFTPQAGRQVPLLSELFAGLRDEVARPYITGTLRNPVVELRQLSRVRGMLGTIFATRQPSLPAPATVPRQPGRQDQ